MKESIARLKLLIDEGTSFVRLMDRSILCQKDTPERWSKQEIIGHLIDSAINNLQRFTEIQFQDKPYRIKRYSQDDLVKANDYQNGATEEILALWIALNDRIAKIMAQQTEESLGFTIVLPDGSLADLRFLMIDYVDHLEHHLLQIRN